MDLFPNAAERQKTARVRGLLQKNIKGDFTNVKSPLT